MAETTIITGQFVRISQTPASIGERLIALVIDVYKRQIINRASSSIVISCAKIEENIRFCLLYTSWLGNCIRCNTSADERFHVEYHS